MFEQEHSVATRKLGEAGFEQTMGRDLEAEGNINNIRDMFHSSDALDPGSSPISSEA